MATVQTVLGPVEASALGFTLSHEHIVASIGQDARHYPWAFDWTRTRTQAITALRTAKAGGVDTVIDLTTLDLGRDVLLYSECARASGMQVVVATGIWLDVPRSVMERDIDATAAIFAREIEVGIGRTDIRAGVIKVATDVQGIGEPQERVLRAAARASMRTGCPISTHHRANLEQGTEQVRIFREEGVQMDRVCIGHSNDTTDVAYLESLLHAGVYLSMDHYPGRPGRLSWQERNEVLRTLIAHGWAHRLMLGHDASAARPVSELWPHVIDEYNPDGMLFLSRVGLPALIASGVAQSDIDTMMREAPRAFLSGVG